jgi:hypothetical protein
MLEVNPASSGEQRIEAVAGEMRPNPLALGLRVGSGGLTRQADASRFSPISPTCAPPSLSSRLCLACSQLSCSNPAAPLKKVMCLVCTYGRLCFGFEAG